jgi:hypothetical protein
MTSSKASFLFRSSFNVSSSTILETAALRMSGVWTLDNSPITLDFLSAFLSQMVGLDTTLHGGDAIFGTIIYARFVEWQFVWDGLRPSGSSAGWTRIF